jgi:hypothetical protein
VLLCRLKALLKFKECVLVVEEKVLHILLEPLLFLVLMGPRHKPSFLTDVIERCWVVIVHLHKLKVKRVRIPFFDLLV